MSRFLQTVREKTRRLGLADTTEKTFTSWARRHILFHSFQSEEEMTRSSRQDIEAFLHHLANQGIPAE